MKMLPYFIKYLKRPKFIVKYLEKNIKEKIKFILKVFLLFIFINIIFINLLKFFDYLNFTNFKLFSIYENINQGSNIIIYNKLFTLILLIILAPLLEELIFRLCFNFKKLEMSLFLLITPYILLGNSFVYFNTKSVLSIILCLFIYIYFVKYFTQKKLNYLRDNYFMYFYYLNCILFGLLHIYNINNLNFSFVNIILYIISIIPQILSAIFISFIRIHFGFWWGLSLHSLTNFLPVLFFILKQ